MNTKNVAAEYRLSYWSHIIQERSASGMSTKKFCETKGFHANSYYYWQRKLRETVCTELSAGSQTKNAGTEKALVPQDWAICTTEDPFERKQSSIVETNDCRVYVEPRAAMDQLVKIVRVLKTV